MLHFMLQALNANHTPFSFSGLFGEDPVTIRNDISSIYKFRKNN
jgi:hypothetical protein